MQCQDCRKLRLVLGLYEVGDCSRRKLCESRVIGGKYGERTSALQRIGESCRCDSCNEGLERAGRYCGIYDIVHFICPLCLIGSS